MKFEKKLLSAKKLRPCMEGQHGVLLRSNERSGTPEHTFARAACAHYIVKNFAK